MDGLKNRTGWQNASSLKASATESSFAQAMSAAFVGTDFRLRHKPREFRNIYLQIPLDAAIAASIYQPIKPYKHGVIPDYAIDNIVTGKTLYVEVKRQDGWVEGKTSSAGRGNAHERSCKFFTPGLLQILRAKGKLDDSVLPFWAVYQGDIARDPKRVREIHCWFSGYSNHFFLWQDINISHPLVTHFQTKLKQILE
jgi:hypothetical protein